MTARAADPLRSIPIATLDGNLPAYVDAAGTISLADGARISWCVVAEDRVHDPFDSTTVRQSSDGAIVETAVRIAGGDAVLRTYAVPDGLVIDFENASPAACALAIIVEPGTQPVHGPRPASQSCVAGSRHGVLDLVTGGATAPGSTDPGDANGLLWPVAHRSSLLLFAGVQRPATIPSTTEVRRGWSARLATGMRVDIADRTLQHALDQARIAILVEAPCADAGIVRALEDWGFDAEGAIAWERLAFRDRRRLRRRVPENGSWERLTAAQQQRPGAALLNAVHDLLISARHDVVDIAPSLPTEWLGVDLAAHDIPLRHGLLSFAIRWHGDRPALLWEASTALELRSSLLAPSWATRDRSGEVLFDPPPTRLFGLASSSGPDETRSSPPMTSFD